jgi:hypothetical protein
MLGRQSGIRRRKKAPVSTLAGAFFLHSPVSSLRCHSRTFDLAQTPDIVLP